MSHFPSYVPLATLFLLAAPSTLAEESGAKPATAATREANLAAAQSLDFADTQDFQDAERGFVGTVENLQIADKDGKVIWSLAPYAFLQDETPPPTVHPSLWRQARLNLKNGLFQVTKGIYQVRGFDLANVTFVEGATGVIVIDPLTSQETAEVALALYRKHRGKRPVKAVIYTHSHVDHFGGVRGMVREQDVRAGRVKILAPEGFLEAAVSENVYAGNAMSRRAFYMYGSQLPRGPQGQVDAGLGKSTSTGTVTLIPPTDTIRRTGEKRVLDGVEIVFMMAPDSEAPAEMLMYFPKQKALCAAEDATHTLHNIYTLRGARVRDPLLWARYLNEAIDTFGGRTEVVFASHHWPTWGKDRVLAFLTRQRDLYKHLHDQALHLMNQGYTMTEIAEALRLPDGLSRPWFNRGYYGSVSHNAKGIYQRYLGWYDSNPANLNPLPRVEAARRYVEYMGGSEEILNRARKAYERGDYRWVAEVVNHVVFAEPDNREARMLQADALEQLGYQAENATWRNEYLVGALELRQGVGQGLGTQTASTDLIASLTPEMVFDYLGIRLDPEKASGQSLSFAWRFTDTNERYALQLSDATLVWSKGVRPKAPDATLSLTRGTFARIISGEMTLAQARNAGLVKVQGDANALPTLMGMMVRFDPNFEIIAPGAPLPARPEERGIGGAGSRGAK